MTCIQFCNGISQIAILIYGHVEMVSSLISVELLYW